MTDTTILREIGHRICERRKELRFTQEKLAEKMGVSINMISNLERGNKAIRPENLIKVCSILNISADYILSGKTDNTQTIELAKKMSRLKDVDYKMVEMIIDTCLKNH
jgi:transcriptional regulator with XRE-family HTH domain